jgi:hypothetical protein
MLNLKAKFTRPKSQSSVSGSATASVSSEGIPGGVVALKAKAKAQPNSTELTLNFLKETPPDLVLELLVPYLLDQLLIRVAKLWERRAEIEARQNELHRRVQDVSGIVSTHNTPPAQYHRGDA